MASVWEWIVAYVGIAGLAMFLLYRSHQNAFRKLAEVYDKQLEHQQMLIDLLQIVISTMHEEARRDDG